MMAHLPVILYHYKNKNTTVKLYLKQPIVMRKKTIISSIAGLIFLFISGTITAQDLNGDQYFAKREYLKAMGSYIQEAKTDPSKYLPLAKCYFANHQISEATEAVKLYLEKDPKANKEEGNSWLELLQRNDDEVRVKNMGSVVNTKGDEYSPVISNDGKTLYFVGYDRAGGLGGEDIWFSKRDSITGNWSTPENFKQLNTTSHEALKAMSPDGNAAILFGNYVGSFGGGDLFYSCKVAGGWTMPCNLGGMINTTNWESQASLGPDGKTLLFISDRDDKSEADMYVSFLTDEGWSKPLNLGPTVNVKGKFEGSPQLAADGKTLYFCSNGHPGFGNKDIFYAKRLDDTWTNWSKPVNMGKYVNTLEEEKYFTLPASGNKAYLIRGDQADGLGATDIYEMVMPQGARPEKTYTISGVITNEKDSTEGIVIKYINMATNKEAARISSNKADGNYYVSLPAYQKYLVVMDQRGFLYHQDTLDLQNPNLYVNKIPIQDKFGSRMNRIKELKADLDKYNNEMQKLIDNKNTNISEAFAQYTTLSENYKKAATELDYLVYDAKAQWLGEENDLHLKVDYKVTRIIIGAKFELKNIFFDIGKATLRKESMVELDKLVDIMNRSDIIIELGGHTDNVGADDANQKLSQERVASVKAYLVSKNVSDNRMAVVGYGEAQPIANNETEEGRQRNRRVEVKITEIRPREGSGEFAKLEQEKKDLSKFDMLSSLQKAGKLGGLPKGSICADGVTFIDNTYKPASKSLYGQIPNYNLGESDNSPIKIEEYPQKKLNVFVGNYGLRYNARTFGGTTKDLLIGAGINIVNFSHSEKTPLKAQSIAIYFPASSTFTKWLVDGSTMREQRFLKNYAAVVGLNAQLFKVDSPVIGGAGIKFASSLPIGVRAMFKAAKGINISPEVWYNIGLIQSGGLNNSNAYDARPRYLHIGVSARMKIFSGSIYINSGPLINFLGVRAGISL